MRLLKLSITEDGWTQPIVITPEFEVVDGFHRWSLALFDVDIQRISNGLVPCVILEKKNRADRQYSTVRHNRARGQHGIKKMVTIIQELYQAGESKESIMRRMGLDEEEFDRLIDFSTSPENKSKDSFGKGWIPEKKS
jgi:ParB-like chromosome segregation protein Spo0J